MEVENMATFSEYKNKKGSFWEFRTVYKDPLTGKRKEKSGAGFSTKREAKKACEDFERDLKDGFNEENIKLKDYINYWLDSHKKDNIRESTYDNKVMQIKKHILPYFQEIKLTDVKPKFYQGFIDQMADQKYARSTIENSHWILHGVFERAVIEKKIKDNPAKIATLKGKQRSQEDLEYIPSDIVNELMIEAYRDRFENYIFFKTLLETGMRKGEATGLTWDCIDMENNLITINKAMDTQTGKFTPTKTENSKRTIWVPDRLIDELKHLRKRQLQNIMAWGDKYDREKNLVFCRPQGQFYPKSTLFNSWQRYQKKANICKGKDDQGKPVYYSIHAIRHTHAVMCLENDMDMKTLQERLGHGNYEVTADVYSHVSDKMKKKTLDKYEQGTAHLLPKLSIEGIYN
jgi:integrase